MLQIKLYVAFILAAAAIGPVVAQPLRESTSFKLPNIPRPQRRQSAPPVFETPSFETPSFATSRFETHKRRKQMEGLASPCQKTKWATLCIP